MISVAEQAALNKKAEVSKRVGWGHYRPVSARMPKFQDGAMKSEGPRTKS